MKKLLLLLNIFMLFMSCEKPEDKAIKIVDEFLTQVNDQTKTVNEELLSENFKKFFTGKSYYTSRDWKLTFEPITESKFVVESRSESYNGWGQPIEMVQGFTLTTKYGGLLISDSYNFIVDDLAFRVVDTEWDFYWDRTKYQILDELKEKLTLEVVTPGYTPYYTNDFRKGMLRLVNNSAYDVENVRIQIEHFDRNGKSVNTDYAYPGSIIRSNGYKEFEWLTTDCARCYKQTYKIIFERESNYR